MSSLKSAGFESARSAEVQDDDEEGYYAGNSNKRPKYDKSNGRGRGNQRDKDKGRGRGNHRGKEQGMFPLG